jgi:inosose dehydratase
MKIGVHPINWSNDDFHELGGDIPLETCLAQMKEAGYEGTELGHKFPKEPERLRETLASHGLRLASAWHSLYTLIESEKSEKRRFEEHLNLLSQMECTVAIIAECSYARYTDRKKPLFDDSKTITDEMWNRISERLEVFEAIAEKRGLRLAYHPHVGTLVESEEEIERLLRQSPSIYLLADTGHLSFAGMHPLQIFRRYSDRIAHVHLKNVRFNVVQTAKDESYSFERSVKEGAFTVPGDGGIDFEPILNELVRNRYRGWVIVEAEQDAKKADPLTHAKKARDYIRKTIGV